MSYSVIWSEASKDEYADILKKIESEYGLESALNFMDKTDEVIAVIGEYPEAGGRTKKAEVRRYVITKQTTLLYEVNDNRVELLHFWETRRDPDKLEDLE